MKIPLTVGVIGNNWYTKDTELFGAVAGALNRSRNGTCWRMEIANHGWLHESFPTLSLSEQILRMNLTQNIVRTSLNYTMKTFMPPYNNINTNTTIAAKTIGYTYLTSEVDQDPPPYQYAPNTTFWRFPVDPATGSTDTPGGWYVPVPSTTTWNKIRNQLGLYGFSAVMMHPYEFSDWDGNDYSETINQTTINDLINLLNLCKNAGLRFVLLSEIDEFFDPAYPNPCPASGATTGSVTTRAATSGSVTTRGATSSPLTTSPLTTSPLTTRAATSGSVTTRAATTSPLTTSPITSGDITTSLVTSGQITTSPLTSGDITTSPITSGDITTSPLTTSPLSTGEITSSEVTTGSISGEITTDADSEAPSESEENGVEYLQPIIFLLMLLILM